MSSTLIPTSPTSPPRERPTGTVKWWCARRKIGFIEPTETGEPVFVYVSDLRDRSPASRLVAGQLVSYDTTRTAGGPRALDVVPVVTP